MKSLFSIAKFVCFTSQPDAHTLQL